MLTKFKRHHVKKVLWGLVIIIIPAFIFWGAASFMAGKGDIVGQIEKHKVTSRELSDYLQLVQMQILTYSGENYPRNMSSPENELQAWRLYLLLWKAKKDGITITDQEVINTIKRQFSVKGKFEPEIYNRFVKYRLRTSPRAFEEFTRKMLIIEKLYGKYALPEVTDQEILDTYKRENEKAKIVYLFLPYESFQQQTGEPGENNILEFYETNKENFREAPKVKLSYIFIADEHYPDLKSSLEKNIPEAKSLEDIVQAVPGLEIKNTDFLTAQSPIEGIGWAPQAIARAFDLEKNKLSPLLQIHNGYLIFVKKDQQEDRIPELSEIKDKIIAQVKEAALREAASQKAGSILQEIAKQEKPALESMARQYQAEFGQTDFFKYYDYVEGVGLDENLSKTVFSAKKGEILSSSFSLSKGVYLIQLVDFLPIDEEQFAEQKEKLAEKIKSQKTFLERLKFISRLEKELSLRIYSSLFK